MDLPTLLESFFNSINSIVKYNIFGISIFIWLALFAILLLVFSVLEKKALRQYGS